MAPCIGALERFLVALFMWLLRDLNFFAYEKIFNIISYQGNAYQNLNELSLQPSKIAIMKNTSTGEDVENSELSYTAFENVKLWSSCGKQFGSFSKV